MEAAVPEDLRRKLSPHEIRSRDLSLPPAVTGLLEERLQPKTAAGEPLQAK